MAHHPTGLRKMGRLVAEAKQLELDDLIQQYEELMMVSLKHKATISKNTNVLQHIKGFFKKHLSQDEKLEMQEMIDHYHQGLTPLIVPITLVQHYVRKYKPHYLVDQYYLQSHPLELKLRNHS